MKLASLLNHISVGGRVCRGRTWSPNIWGPSLLGAEFVRGRVCQGPSLLGIHDNSSKDTSSNTTFGRIRQLVECNVWSKWTIGLNLYFVEMCLKFV